MKHLSTSLKAIAAVFSLITAFLLVIWVLDIINDEDLRDTLVKVAAITGIVTALTLVMQLLTGSSDKK